MSGFAPGSWNREFGAILVAIGLVGGSNSWHQRRNKIWLANLKAAGVHPEDVDYVFCTHLLLYHCGCNTPQV